MGAAAVVPSAQSQSSVDTTPTFVEMELPPLPFVHGVASGDPLPDAVVLWTRVTPDEFAVPGSGGGVDTQLHWCVARDAELSDIVAQGEATSRAEQDHTVHVEVAGLDADTVYYYRFTVVGGPHHGAVSPLGRTKTAPAGHVVAQRWAVASCANWESGFFSAYADMARRGWAGELDLTVFLGDYIYEYAQYEYAGRGPVRLHQPAHETLSLADYRTRYGRYRTDPALQDAHAAMPWVVVWDDHEFANNNWRDGAENHNADEGDFHTRRDAAMRAYYEWMPVRLSQTSEQGHIYRSFTFGDLVELTMMDLRSFRDEETTGDRFGEDSRTMLGEAQFKWVAEQLQQSDARWDVLGNSVMVSPMRFVTIQNNKKANIATGYMQERATGIAVNSDQWDGYAAERDRLLTMLDEQESNALFLTGDIHSEWANSIVSPSGFGEIGCEMVTTSISAPNVDEILTDVFGTYHKENNSTSLLVEKTIRDYNPWVSHIDFDAHGYGIASIHYDYVDMLYYRVSDVEDPDATVALGTKRQWRIGEGFVEA
mgnify:CR=1 FL=1